ncbi:MAG: sigma 54-interacting transcriptional regulator, partial [Candidatus Binatia bacterium]
AFTGAIERRLGLMEAADGGTLFLDEIGEMNPAVQAKLLRALESGEIRRIGENRTTRVNVRVIAATNKDLSSEVTAGKFREDLFYRLNGVPLEVLPLRERREDIEPLLRHFVGESGGREISAEALDLLKSYAWPGNVRELKNCIDALCIFGSGRVIHAEDLPPQIRAASAPTASSWSGQPIRKLDEIADEYVLYALERCGGNKSQAARLLGIDPKTLYKRLKK